MQHIINVAFDFDDEAVAKKIKENAERVVLGEIRKDVEGYLFNVSRYYKDDRNRIEEISKDYLNKILEEHKDQIITMAVERLADRLSRTKAAREKIQGLEV